MPNTNPRLLGKNQPKNRSPATTKTYHCPRDKVSKPTPKPIMQNANNQIASALRNMTALKETLIAENSEALAATIKDIDKVSILISRISTAVLLYTTPDIGAAPAPITVPIPIPAPTPSTPSTPVQPSSLAAPTDITRRTLIVVNAEKTNNVKNRRHKIIIDAMKQMASPTTENEVRAYMSKKINPEVYTAFMTNDDGTHYKSQYYNAFSSHMEQLRKLGVIIAHA